MTDLRSVHPLRRPDTAWPVAVRRLPDDRRRSSAPRAPTRQAARARRRRRQSTHRAERRFVALMPCRRLLPICATGAVVVAGCPPATRSTARTVTALCVMVCSPSARTCTRRARLPSSPCSTSTPSLAGNAGRSPTSGAPLARDTRALPAPRRAVPVRQVPGCQRRLSGRLPRQCRTTTSHGDPCTMGAARATSARLRAGQVPALMARPAYRERSYRAARADLAAHPRPCRCGAQATTLDHVPPLALHQHQPGSGCCQLVAACVPCNLGAGAGIAARRRRARRANATRRW